VSELDALREGTAALLEARGAHAEAAVVRTGTLSLLQGKRRWSVGSREVDALAFELSLGASPFAELRSMAGGVERVRDALADAVASEATMLSDLHVVLRLPGPDVPWGAVYRTAPARPPEISPDERSVRAAAIDLLRAEGEDDAADLLQRAELTSAALPAGGALPLRRWVIRLRAADAAVALLRPTEEILRRAVTAAATRATEQVAGVEIAVG
jgi:hypothetical protein